MAAAWLLEAVGLALFVTLLGQMLFFRRALLDPFGLAVGIGILPALLTRRAVRTPIDVPLALYVGLTLLSAAVNHGRYVPVIGDDPTDPWRPAVHAAALAIYMYGASCLLRTRVRLATLLAGLTIVISLFGVQAAYDHAPSGFASRLYFFPSVGQWNGFDELGALTALALPLPLAVAVVSRSWIAVVSSSIVMLVLLLDAAGFLSRAAFLGIGAAGAAMAFVEWRKLNGKRLVVVAAIGIVMVTVTAAVTSLSPIAFVRGDAYTGRWSTAGTARLFIWKRALGLVAAHPLIGVGPSNYTDAMKQKYPDSTKPYPESDALAIASTGHAHNTLIHVAAESGIPAAAAFVWMGWGLLTGLVRASARTATGALALGLLGALVAFFVANLLEHLLTYLTTGERMGFLLWTFFAAAVAAARLGRLPEPPPDLQ